MIKKRFRDIRTINNNNINNMSNKIITEIPNLAALANLLAVNPGLVIIKFGAEWCGPCKKIDPLVDTWFTFAPTSVQCCKVDVDDNFELYGFLKTKRQINGIPAIFCYVKGNNHYIPDDMVVGADPNAINDFFNRCMNVTNKQEK